MSKLLQSHTYEALIKLDHYELLKLIGLNFSNLVTENIDWGNNYFTLEWLTVSLQNKWHVLDCQPGLNQCNQDVYLLERI